MKIRIDNSGRMVVPKTLRRRLGVERETEIEAVEQPDGVLLRPVKQRPSLLEVGGVWVHQGVPEPGTDWQRVVEDVREERLRDSLK